MQVSVDGGGEPTWAHDGTTLFYRGPTRMMAATVVERPSLAVTRRDSLFADGYTRYQWYAAYDVFPSGDFLMTMGPVTTSRIFVIVTWPELAGKQGGTGTARLRASERMIGEGRPRWPLTLPVRRFGRIFMGSPLSPAFSMTRCACSRRTRGARSEF